MKTGRFNLTGFPHVIWFVLAVVLSAGCTRQARISRHLDRGDRYFAQQQWDRAELEYMNVLRLDSKQAVALARLGTIYYDRGQLRQAFMLLSNAEKVTPTNEDVEIKLAKIYGAGGQLEQARSAALRVLDQNPANGEALLVLSEAIAKPEQVAETEQKLQLWQRQFGERAVYHLALAQLALRRSDLGTAERELGRAQSLEPKSGPALLALANLRWRQGDFKQADASFKNALALATNDWRAGLAWADFKLRTGQAAEAKSMVADLAQKMPLCPPISLYQARIALSEKKYDEALASLKRVLDKDPADLEASLLRAQTHMASGRSTEAVTELEALRERLPKLAQIQYQLALAYLMSKDLTKASSSLKQAIALEPGLTEAILLLAELDIRKGNPTAAIDAMSGLLKRSPKIEQAYAVLADAYRSQGKLDGAVSVYRQWIEISPKAARAPYLLGLTLRQQRKNAEARQSFETALQLAPDFLQAVEQLVDLDLIETNYPAALARLEPLASKSPRAAGPWLLRARVHLAQRNSDAAEADLQKAIELDPNASKAYMLLAALYVDAHKTASAMEKLQALVARNPKDGSALLLLAQIQEQSLDYAKARENYQRVLALSPNSRVALNNLAYLCAEHLNDLEAGYQYAQKARDLAPADPAVADTFGWILWLRKDYAWAASTLREAAVKLPNDPEIQFHFGMASYMMGDEDAARPALSRAADKDSPVKAKAEQALWVLNLNPQQAQAEELSKLKQLISNNGTDVFALLRSAAVAEREGDLNRATECYRRAVQASPKSAPLLVRLGRFYAERLQDPGKALEQGKAARELAQDDPSIARAVAQIALEAKDFKLAYRLGQETVAKNPEDGDALFDLAMAAYGLGHVPEAQDAAKRALTATSSFSHADPAKLLLEMITAGSEPASAQSAQARAQQILQAQPDYVPALVVVAVAQEAQGQSQAAINTLQQILKINPDFALAARRLASLYARGSGNDRQVFDLGMKAREVFSDDAELAKIAGRAAYRLKEYGSAAELLRASCQKRPQDAEVYFDLGMTYYALNQKPQSKAALEKALALNLTSNSALEARRLLAELK